MADPKTPSESGVAMAEPAAEAPKAEAAKATEKTAKASAAKPNAKGKPAPPKKVAAEPATASAPLPPKRSQTTKLAIMVYAFSTIFHAAVLIACSWILLPEDVQQEILGLVSPVEDPMEEEEAELEPIEEPAELVENLEPTDADVDNVQSEVVNDIPTLTEMDVDDLDTSMPVPDFPIPNAPSVKVSDEAHGRSQKARAQMVAKYGGSAASEKAVTSGLKWLASVQLPDGSWDFGLLPKNSGEGSLKNQRMGGTGIALLCYLGAGHTHLKGSYKPQVERGLSYLLNNMKVTPEGGDCRGPSPGNDGMYVQGICALALTEAYALTPGQATRSKRTLKTAAQLALNFIVLAQDPKGGGWRYRPRQAGDTSVVGWQLMALLSAKNSGLRVPPQTFRGAEFFLDSVTEDGSTYGYTGPQDKPSTTAIGLLCRMYMGWRADNESLQKGVKFLGDRGPSGGKRDGRYSADMYYNYYATQVMHHWGGEDWKKWNAKMRDYLVKSQIQEGPESGSWDHPAGHSGEKGGRLFQTAMSIMTLEVYYRHLPIYQRKNVIADEKQLK